jgi:predicted peptidase
MSMQPQSLALDTEVRKRVQLRYLLWLPSGYDDDQRRWPLILFLHGRGERGDDLSLVMREGLARRLAEGFELPAIVAAPQCPSGSDWTLHDDALLALLDDLDARLAVDPRRVYLTGLSMGGRGAWRLAATNADLFAALITICARRPDAVRDREDARPLVGLPIWVFHGAQDQVVPVEESDAMVEALRAHGADVRYTVYPDAGHDSWTQAYAEDELYTWMFARERTAGA